MSERRAKSNTPSVSTAQSTTERVAGPDAAAPTMTLGAVLAATRQRRGLNQQQVAESLKLDASIVHALECDALDRLPHPAYARGYYRTYARLLGVEASQWLGPLSGSGPVASAVARPLRRHAPQRRNHEHRGVLAVSLGVALLVGAIGVWLQSPEQVANDESRWLVDVAQPDQSESQPTAHHDVGLTVVETIPAETFDEVAELIPARLQANADGGWGLLQIDTIDDSAVPEVHVQPLDETDVAPRDGELLVQLSGASWLDIRDADDARLLYGLFDGPGDYLLQGAPPYRVVVGDASQVTLHHAGAPLELGSAEPGRVVRLQVP